MNTLKFKRIGTHKQPLPFRAHPTDAGIDLSTIKPALIPPNATVLLSTGFALHLDPGYVAFVVPRSGMSLKTDLRIANAPGTIDAGYRGEIKLLAWNKGDDFLQFKAGDKIAQLIILKCELLEIEETFENENTDRNEKGFGSSGISHYDKLVNEHGYAKNAEKIFNQNIQTDLNGNLITSDLTTNLESSVEPLEENLIYELSKIP